MKGKLLAIIAINLVICVTVCAKSKRTRKIGPSINDKDILSCQKFAKNARFYPYSILDDIWVVFFYWGPIMPLTIYKFTVRTTRTKQIIQQKYLNDSLVSYPVNWSNPVLVMTEKPNDISNLLVQMGDRGEFLRYPIMKKNKKRRLIYPEDLNFKQFDNGKYIAFIKCVGNEAYMLSRPRDVPKKAVIQDVAAKLGFRGRNGKSYLYQGHQWMPIPESEDYEPEMFYKYTMRLQDSSTMPQRTLQDGSMQQQTSKNDSMQQQTSKDDSMQQQTSKDDSMQQRTLQDGSVQQQTSKDDSMQQRTLQDGSVQQQTSKDDSMQQRTLQDGSMQQQTSKDDSMQQLTLQDDSMPQRISPRTGVKQ